MLLLGHLMMLDQMDMYSNSQKWGKEIMLNLSFCLRVSQLCDRDDKFI